MKHKLKLMNLVICRGRWENIGRKKEGRDTSGCYFFITLTLEPCTCFAYSKNKFKNERML